MKLGRILLGSVMTVGGMLIGIKGIVKVMEGVGMIEPTPSPKIVISLIKPVEEVVEAASTES